MTEARTSASTRAAAAAARGWPLSGALVASAVTVAIVGVGVLWGAGGWRYYSTPLGVRAYAPHHGVLRPSGAIGHSLGIAGLLMMLVPVAYTARKKWRRLSRAGSMKTWLDVHIYCGIVGPVLVTFHSALKFNGVVSVAYWSMMAVMLSGFVGRYLYVRMPRSIRGVELTYEEIAARAATLESALADLGLPAALVARLQAAGNASSDTPLRRRFRLRTLQRKMSDVGVDPSVAREAVELAGSRASLVRRLAYLRRTRQLFALWHVFHQPFVYVMFAVVLVHIGVALYLGYAFFLQ
jgi:hypothetical protein